MGILHPRKYTPGNFGLLKDKMKIVIYLIRMTIAWFFVKLKKNVNCTVSRE